MKVVVSKDFSALYFFVEVFKLSSDFLNRQQIKMSRFFIDLVFFLMVKSLTYVYDLQICST